MCNFDDADFKNSIVIQNIPWGSTVGKVSQFINDTLY